MLIFEASNLIKKHTKPMGRILETEHLYLRKFALKDAAVLFKRHNNPEDTSSTESSFFKSVSDAENFITNFSYSDNSDIGCWGICEKRQGELVGWCSLTQEKSITSINLECCVFQKHRNKGYATETVNSLISYTFNKLRLQNINININKQHDIALKIAANFGFQLINNNDETMAIYHLKNTLVEVREFNTIDTYNIRHQVLRQGKPIESCKFEGDDLETTFHLGLFFYGELIGVATYMKNSNQNFSEEIQYQLRGMAILQQFQGKKFGNVILKKADELLKHKECQLIWCNARESAVNFYSNFGFKISGDAFEIPEIGTHFAMYYTL